MEMTQNYEIKNITPVHGYNIEATYQDSIVNYKVIGFGLVKRWSEDNTNKRTDEFEQTEAIVMLNDSVIPVPAFTECADAKVLKITFNDKAMNDIRKFDYSGLQQLKQSAFAHNQMKLMEA